MISYNETGVMAGLRTALIIALFIIGGGAIAATVAGFFGDAWWGFDYVANFRWQLMWILLVTAIVYTLTARGVAGIFFLAAALVNAWLISPLWLGDQPAATGEDGVRIVHADIYPGVADFEHALRWLAESKAELILVSGTTAERMEPLTTSGRPYSILAAPEQEGQAGIVILGTADWPIETFHTTGLSEPVHRITVGSNGETVNVVTAWGDLARDSKDADRLAARLETVTEAVSTSPHPIAVIGNLGATRWTHGMQTLHETQGLRDATEGSGYLSTWPISGIPLVGGWVGIPVDIVLMTEEITPLELLTGPDIGGQHLPLTIVIGPGYLSPDGR